MFWQQLINALWLGSVYALFALGYTLVDTGALYRTVALAAERKGLSWSDESAVATLAEGLAEQGAVRFEGQRITLFGEDVSQLIRTQEIAEGASQVSAIPGVRAALLDMQRAAGVEGGVRVTVADNGPGFAPDLVQKLHTPFFSTKPTGSGLGLTICAQIIKALEALLRLRQAACHRGLIPGQEAATSSKIEPTRAASVGSAARILAS